MVLIIMLSFMGMSSLLLIIDTMGMMTMDTGMILDQRNTNFFDQNQVDTSELMDLLMDS
jgi:hypothetical protein